MAYRGYTHSLTLQAVSYEHTSSDSRPILFRHNPFILISGPPPPNIKDIPHKRSYRGEEVFKSGMRG